jgi:hypothetical protein
VTGLGRARDLLEQVSHPDREWWAAVERLGNPVQIIDAAGARPEDRERLELLREAVPRAVALAVGSHSSDDAICRAVLDFLTETG